MATPALIERITKEDPDAERHLSVHEVEAGIAAIHGGTVSKAEFLTGINATADDTTDTNNLVGLVNAHADLDDKNKEIFRIIGTISLGAHGRLLSAAAVRTRLGIPTP